MIFARRAIQARLTELRRTIDDNAVDNLAVRLNRPGKDRLAAMWEVVVLEALTKSGTLQNEAPLASGKRPDILFESGALRFTADITTVSDEGLDKDNPYFELSALINKAKTKLGLPIGGLDLRVKSMMQESARGARTRLRLPPRGQLQAFVTDQIVPQLRQQKEAGEKQLKITIDDDQVGLEITIDPARSPYSTGGFAAYDIPEIKDRNPLYNALNAKAEQLHGATTDAAGVIVCDGDCAALSDRQPGRNSVSTAEIIKEFLRQHSSIDFVLLLTVREPPPTSFRVRPVERRIHPIWFCRPENRAGAQINAIFTAMLASFPKPIMMANNGALRARESGYDLGYHGGYQMEDGKIRISSRELVEILAGLRTLADNGAKNVEAARKGQQRPNTIQMMFLKKLTDGRLPSRVNVIKTAEDDDRIEFEFGEPDPAISPFR